MQLAKKTVLTNSAMTTLGTSKRILEDAIIDLHRNDNDNWAIGDIKTTNRTISDANWHKCDGSFMTANLSNDIKNTLVRHNNFKLQKAAMQDTTPTSYWTYYSDANYVIIGTAYTASNAGGWVKLFIYTRDANGNLVANSQKTLRSWSDKYSMAWSCPIIKCGNYYYTVVRYDDENSSGLEQRYWHLYYTTNPAGTWSSRQVWAGGNSYANCLGFYTNGSTARLELSNYTGGSASNPREVIVYTFSGDASNITSSTYNLTVGLNSCVGRSDTNLYPMGDGKYFSPLSTGGRLTYKASFTSNSWTTIDPPSWAHAVYGVYYINGKYYGVFKRANTGNPYEYIFAWSTALNTLMTSSLANLQYLTIPTYTELYNIYGRTNAGVISAMSDRITVDSTTTYENYQLLLTENGIKKKLINNDAWPSGSLYCITNPDAYTAVMHVETTEFKNNFYFMALSYPNMTDEPYDAYMKIATN